MALLEFLSELDELATAGNAAFDAAVDAAAVEAARVEFLGAKSGRLKAVQKGLGGVSGPDKPAAGKHFNEVKSAIETAFSDAVERLARRLGLESASQLDLKREAQAEDHRKKEKTVVASATIPIETTKQMSGHAHLHLDVQGTADAIIFDPTLPGGRKPAKDQRGQIVLGHLHPLTQTIEELKDIMGRLGFTVADGPEVEDEWHNFEALNIPASHPARDPLENFYLATAAVGHSGPLLLRSQTSTVQIRVMEKQKPPVRVISLGRVYRPDDADATHYPMFHQIEGLLVDKNVTMADLKSVLRLFAASFLGHDVHIRFRPSFFPFTEPSVEVDMAWETIGGKTRYVEMGGAGMVDPNVLKAVGYDPEEVTGFAFGLGVERVCARRHGVADIREFYRNDVRFLNQF